MLDRQDAGAFVIGSIVLGLMGLVVAGAIRGLAVQRRRRRESTMNLPAMGGGADGPESPEGPADPTGDKPVEPQ